MGSLFFFLAILGHRRHKDMMSGKHHTLFFLVGLTCAFFLQSDAASVLNVNLKIDVNGKTAIDQSFPTSKLFRFLLMVLYKNYTYKIRISLHLLQKLHMIIFSLGIPKNAPMFMAVDAESGPEPDWCKVVDCTKPGASHICFVTCPMAEKDMFLARISKSGMNFFSTIHVL